VTVNSRNDAEVLGEMLRILRAVSGMRTPDRALAVQYTESRGTLLKSRLRPCVPGFLMQCVSVHKFHDFINLFDAEVDARIRFIERAFEGCREAPGPGRHTDVFGDDGF
jgi:hypothetical protein